MRRFVGKLFNAILVSVDIKKHADSVLFLLQNNYKRLLTFSVLANTTSQIRL